MCANQVFICAGFFTAIRYSLAAEFFPMIEPTSAGAFNVGSTVDVSNLSHW
jgi:hypothetical protein